VYDTSRADDGNDLLLATSKNANSARFRQLTTASSSSQKNAAEFQHYESVRSVLWVPADHGGSSNAPEDLRRWQMLSWGSDGKVFVWELDLQAKALVPVRGALIVQGDLLTSTVSSSANSSLPIAGRFQYVRIRSTSTQ
jgi:hypothetical protein